MDPFDAVASWRPVSDRWVLHRPEPLLHERSWGCALELTPEQAAAEPWLCEGGFDAAGRPIARRQFDPDGTVASRVVVVEAEGAKVVLGPEGEVARTVLDSSGRLIRTTYAEGPDERYEYDERGRLVVIHDNPELSEAGPRFWLTSDGPLAVEYEGDEPARITNEHGVVWEAPRMPWEDELREGADAIAAECLKVIAAACRNEEAPAGTGVFALCLIYVDQGSLHCSLSFGLEADRRSWMEEDLDGDELAIKLFYVNANNEGLNFIEDEVVPPAMDERLLRGASINQPGDPYRAVLGEVARRLATASFEPMLKKTDDFVVFIAEHDEGFAPKVRSIHEHNPPEQVARWEASWPPGAPRGEDEPW